MEKYIPWVISALSLLLAYLTFRKNGKKEIREEERKMEEINQNLLRQNIKQDSILSAVQEIRTDIKANATEIKGLDKRVIIVEHDLSTIHKEVEKLNEAVKR